MRTTQLRYVTMQQEFIEDTVRNLQKIWAVYRNPNAKWASPALAFSKPGKNQLRFTVDLSGLNGVKLLIQSGMPHLDLHQQQCAERQCFANIDFCHRFRQISLSKPSQKVMSTMTHIGIFSPMQTIPGGSDYACYFHNATREKFLERIQNKVQSVGDCLLCEENEEKVLDSLALLLKICSEFDFRMQARNSNSSSSSKVLQKYNFCSQVPI